MKLSIIHNSRGDSKATILQQRRRQLLLLLIKTYVNVGSVDKIQTSPFLPFLVLAGAAVCPSHLLRTLSSHLSGYGFLMKQSYIVSAAKTSRLHI